METKMLYYKIFKKKVEPVDYVNWAIKMLESSDTSASLNILSSLSETLNTFEVEDYFHRAVRELGIEEPSQDKCSKYYFWYLLKQIIDNESNAINYAYEIYQVVREEFVSEELNVWYEISEMIDDYRYGDNIEGITIESLISTIVKEAKKQLNCNFFLN
ncbi:hypothetical protein FQ087_12735 [Sporosarcina sp. ANT_H38]|uniref:hypothetical protein n=1 Tax=Sporosarcina sp. ANT_H38 TaxID=2597358 RepID=UPI0011F3BAED|nr:hypothetical protein [Sporosarcina sp. ANT_H38]KAA0955437.1 hypothetical protein FQ087_12530 [Sporosarcina sp. ANT_H38]KAA0955473.1 hypothetical protein FQ087_12735 [Sporosarcina sp. ANT_H38]